MPRRKQDIRRRTGCVECKAKHLRCSEEHPRCRRCERLNIACVRGLRLIFREDALQRGVNFGREGVWTKRPGSKPQSRKAAFHAVPLDSYIDRWVFLNVTVDEFPAVKTSESPSDPQSEPHTALSPLPPSSPYHPLHSFADSDAYLLDYFIRGISPSCSLSASHNPYVSLVIPLCFVSDTLRYSLLAAAANQLCILGRPQFTHEACHYKQKALEGLRHEISTGFHTDGTVAAVLMLCFQDISDGCSASWRTHLRGGLQLIEHYSCHSSPSLWNFFRMYFVAHDIMSRTISEDEDEETLQLWSDGDDLEEIDVVMGCSRGLMSLIHRISILASAKAKILTKRCLTPIENQDFEIATSELYTALLSLKQKLPEHSIERKDLEQVAHIKHLAALLYFNERLGSSRPAPKFYHERSEDDPGPCDRDDLEPYSSKEQLISSVIESITTLPDMATLLWPLFVLGNAGLENEDHRRFVLDRLSRIQKMRNLGSVRRTIEAVKHAFGTKDLAWRGDRVWGHESYRYISLA
ncbi:Zn(II)2Cys6 transcription factor [Aspergillus lucknowensis]|uniref:Fungal-specific transcription factor domain-containing protein n=1 Tax=Aspergillus lucknowensis TaxID=176173 RepID=A0ABR4M3M4_9EURO